MRRLLVLVVLPVSAWLAAVLVSLGLRASLPDPMAVHFDLAGAADGYLSFGTNLWVLTGILTLFLVAFAAAGLPARRPAAIARAAGMLATGTAVLLAGVQILLVLVQRDLTTADAARLNPAFIGLALLLAGGAAAGAHRLVPSEQAAQLQADPDAPRLDLPPDVRAVWTRGQTMSGPAVAVPALIATAVVIGGYLASAWPFVALGLLLGVLVVGMGWWTVTVDVTGVRYVSVLGWPRRSVALREVLDAAVVQVRPLRDAGGWGIRVNKAGETGLYLRAGQALHVRLVDGRGLVVTVDDAATAAGLLNSLRDRAR